MASRIEDYAMIGDLGTAALVGRDGAIDWLCWPRFDSDACFAALLGAPEHGRSKIAPRDANARITRRYRPNTLILETRFETAEGAATLIDFMPPRETHSRVVRMVVGERGRVPFHAELILRFGYGATVPWVTRIDDNTLRAVAGPDMVVLHSSVDHHGEGLKTVADFTIGAGETASFIMSYELSHRPVPAAVDPQESLRATEKMWTTWVAKNNIKCPWGGAVERSLITLKALTFAPTGGIVAAPTTSLPECLGGPRNWDYRFCWLRDATLTLIALMDAGFYDEAQSWRDWLLRAVAGSPEQAQIMYGIAGERRLTEIELPWLPGHQGSVPVRVGNAAHGQLQLDIFGEVMDALHQARCKGLAASESGWALQQAFLSHLERIWTEPDEGIWETRGGPQHFTYSKVMAWVAFDRSIKSAEQFGLEAPLDRWRQLAAAIHADVCRRGFDQELGSFVQSYGSKHLDASLLLLPLVGFLPPDDPRVRGTLQAIERRLFERLLGLRNDVGLLSEEYDPRTGRLVGNFPQAFTHVGLVNSAFNLTQLEAPEEHRAEPAADGVAASAAAGE